MPKYKVCGRRIIFYRQSGETHGIQELAALANHSQKNKRIFIKI